MQNIIQADFHGTPISLIEHNHEPYITAKEIVEALRLDWAGQYSKLNHNKARWTIEKISIVAKDGLQREAICMPLRKLPAWPMTIQANKVPNELRPKIIQYQTECDEVLWKYWNEKQKPQALPAPVAPMTPTLPVFANNTITIVTVIRPHQAPQSTTYNEPIEVIPAQALVDLQRQTQKILVNAEKQLQQLFKPFASLKHLEEPTPKLPKADANGQVTIKQRQLDIMYDEVEALTMTLDLGLSRLKRHKSTFTPTPSAAQGAKP
ncbi:phage antirepressor N-terminal domain-containing protein [Thiolinea disciformis]|uniref:phage antirepressor N-terminal domain-containing protein n=1 Tax=Thiolinea disciformis TaxID=125614 RepID=UPI00037C3830|nr:phage antirepressor N-terminal domain-containing protein [Thiolinea disciformis]